MEIVETSVFTRRILQLFSDEEYRLLQAALVVRPDMGKIIPGSGGLRKARWRIAGKGKRGGVRFIYYWAVEQERLLLLFLYPKSAQEDLTPAQVKVLRRIVEEELP